MMKKEIRYGPFILFNTYRGGEHGTLCGCCILLEVNDDNSENDRRKIERQPGNFQNVGGRVGGQE